MALKSQSEKEKELIDKILEDPDSSDEDDQEDADILNHNNELDKLFGKQQTHQSRDRGLFSGQTSLDSELLSGELNTKHQGGALKDTSSALQKGSLAAQTTTKIFTSTSALKATNDKNNVGGVNSSSATGKVTFGGLKQTKYIELSSDESSDDGLEEAEALARLAKTQKQIDLSDDSSDESSGNSLKNLKNKDNETKNNKRGGYLAEFEAKKGLKGGDLKQRKVVGLIGGQSKTDLYRNADLVTLVELNERQSDLLPEKLIEQASQLLSFDKAFYSVKKELLLYSQFQTISHALYDDMSHPYSGLVSCIKMFRAKNGNVIFVGNSNGYIRVFDIKTQKQMKPLYHESLSQTKVLCMDISEDGHYLLAGYKRGLLVLWDSSKYSMALTMKDVAKSAESEFTQVKILFVSAQNVITIVTAEAQGTIRLVHVTRSYFGSFSHKVNSLYESDLIGAASIAVQRPSSAPEYFSPFCQNACFVAFGATNMVTLVEMRQFPPQPILTIKRPTFFKESSVPYLDWGYGLTPQNREKTVPLLCVAWERVIMLLYVNEATQALEFDGYYCCDQEIHMAYFVADSVIFAIVTAERDVTQHEVRMIYTEKFRPGEISDLDLSRTAGEDIQHNANFQGTVEGTKGAELETGHIILDLRRSFIKVPSGEKSDRQLLHSGVGNGVNGQLLKQNSFYNNSVTHFKKNIIYICEKRVMMARLFSWREYIDKLKFTDNQDWLSVLQVALEIYQGDLKGFAMLPDAKERRQDYLKSYMKNLIMTSIQMVIFKYNNEQSGNKTEGDSTRVDSDSEQAANNLSGDEMKSSSSASKFKIEDIAIKVAIEFCLRIGETEYLFDAIFNFFVEKDLSDKFVGQLCAPILASQFRKEFIPEHIVLKLIHMYESKKQFKVLEKIIQQINLKAYKEDHELAPGQTSLRQHLVFICRAHCLVSALLYLFTSDSKKQGGCQQILEMMLRNMEEKGNLEQHAAKKDNAMRIINKEDIRLLRSTDSEAKYQIEKSHIYIGYKLFWIVKMFLQGKKFPEGTLEASQWRQHTYHIVDFISNEDNLSEMLDFDPEHLFQILVLLFKGKPWQFLTDSASAEYKFQITSPQIKEKILKERERRNNKQQARFGVAISTGALDQMNSEQLDQNEEESGDNDNAAQWESEEESGIANLILEVLQIASERSFRKNVDFAKACYQEFILRVVVAQRQEDIEFQDAIKVLQNNVIGRALLAHQSKQLKEPYKKISINYNRFYAAIKSAFKGKKGAQNSSASGASRVGGGMGIGVSSTTTGGESNSQIDCELIIEALKANKLKKVHIDQILEQIKMISSPLTNVKIQLYENKHDYVEAFMQHMNSNMYKKQVFKWLLSTFEHLTQLEKEMNRDERRALQQKHGDLEFSSNTNDKATAKTYQQQKSVSGQNGESSGDEGDEGDEGQTGGVNRENYSQFVMKAYPPLQDLRNAVKGKMLTLAQLDTQETMQLIRSYFDDDDYQERLIMTEFLKFPKTQLEYLVSYIKTNEKQIETTILEDYISQNQLLKTKYEAYLVQFTTLLCQFEPNELEKWVSKNYFPPEKCLPVVRKFDHDQGEAILCQRSGDHLQAIDVYMGILDKVSIQKLLEQIKLIYRDEPVFLDEMDQEKIAKAQSMGNRLGGHVKQKQTSLKQIALFDQILGKACEICLSEDMEFDKRQTGWFIILDYLQNYMIDASIKCYEAMKSASSNVGGTKYSAITEQNKAEFTDKLKTFITVRINYILRFPGLSIPLELIVKRLNLTFEQIQKLCASKLKHNSVTMRIEQCQEHLVKGQLFDMINEYSSQKGRGYAVEPTKRFVTSKRQKGNGPTKRKIKGNTICNECLNSIVMNVSVVPIRIFQCSHQFHENCIKNAKRCPICSKLDFALLREEQDNWRSGPGSGKAGRGRMARGRNGASRGRTSSIDSNSGGNTENNGGQAMTISTQAEEDSLSEDALEKQNKLKNSLQSMMTKSLQKKKLEIVEQTFDETCLTLEDFC